MYFNNHDSFEVIQPKQCIQVVVHYIIMLHHGFHGVINMHVCLYVHVLCMHKNMQVCILYLHLLFMHAVCYQRVFIYTSFDLHIIVFIRTCHCKCIIKHCFERKWSVICWINYHTKSEGKCNNL